MDRTTFEQTAVRLRPLIFRIGRDFFGSTDDAEDVALLPAVGREPSCGGIGCEGGEELLCGYEATATLDAGESE